MRKDLSDLPRGTQIQDILRFGIPPVYSLLRCLNDHYGQNAAVGLLQKPSPAAGDHDQLSRSITYGLCHIRLNASKAPFPLALGNYSEYRPEYP